MMASPSWRSSMGESSEADAAPIEGRPEGCPTAGATGKPSARLNAAASARLPSDGENVRFQRFMAL